MNNREKQLVNDLIKLVARGIDKGAYKTMIMPRFAQYTLDEAIEMVKKEIT